jgi:phosphoacetylglucosamine mutase
LHHKAEHFDIGIYYESNGHGTVIFHEQFLKKFDVFIENQEGLFESNAVK